MLRTIIVPLLLLPGMAEAAQPVTGVWLTDTKDGLIEIAPCGQRLCGRLVRSLVPIKPPGTDVNNPDPKLRGRPILGMAVLTGFSEEPKLWRGHAYDPKAGKSYKTTILRTGPNTLKLTGCVAIFCRSVTWTKAK